MMKKPNEHVMTSWDVFQCKLSCDPMILHGFTAVLSVWTAMLHNLSESSPFFSVVHAQYQILEITPVIGEYYGIITVYFFWVCRGLVGMHYTSVMQPMSISDICKYEAHYLAKLPSCWHFWFSLDTRNRPSPIMKSSVLDKLSST